MAAVQRETGGAERVLRVLIGIMAMDNGGSLGGTDQEHQEQRDGARGTQVPAQ